MPRTLMTIALVVAVIGLGLWLTGALAPLQQALSAAQRETQDGLAAAVRAVRGGTPGAMAALLALTFGYGVLHAAGPGHGKLLIGGYAVARRVRTGPVIALALGASLAQAAVAVVLVYAAVGVLDWTRDAVVGVSDTVMTPVSHALVALLGLWLVSRSLRRLWRQNQTAARKQRIPSTPQRSGVPDLRAAVAHGHLHRDHVHDDACNHAHGPTLAEMAEVATGRDAALLIAGVAVRPCSGALFLLIMTWHLGIGAAGIAGVFAMGLGTALVTIGAALLAVWARQGAARGLAGAGVTRALPLLELGVGLLILIVAATQLSSAF